MTLPTTTSLNGCDDDSDMFGPPRSSPPIGYHHHRSRVPMISPKLRQREERKRILQLCAHKLERIKDSETNLRRSVCINNTYCRLTDELRREKQSRYLANMPRTETKPETARDNIFNPYNACGNDTNSRQTTTPNTTSSSSSSVSSLPTTVTATNKIHNDNNNTITNHSSNNLFNNNDNENNENETSNENLNAKINSLHHHQQHHNLNHNHVHNHHLHHHHHQNQNQQQMQQNQQLQHHHHHHQQQQQILSSQSVSQQQQQHHQQHQHQQQQQQQKSPTRKRQLSSNNLHNDLEILDRELNAIDAPMPLIDPEITQGAEQLEKAISSRKRLRSEDESDRLVREALSQFYTPQRLISAIEDCPLDVVNVNVTNVSVMNSNGNITTSSQSLTGKRQKLSNGNDLDFDFDVNQNQKDFEVIMDALRLGSPSPTSSMGGVDSCGQAAMMSESASSYFLGNMKVVTSLET